MDMAETFLNGIVAIELGDRQAVGACGSLLADLGATVILLETRGAASVRDSKWQHRAVTAAGKRSIACDPMSAADMELMRTAIESSDVVLTSSDMQPDRVRHAMQQAVTGAIVCDISAFGTSGPLAGRGHSDFLLQAMSGAMDTTGAADGAPTPTRIPLLEMTAAIYATAGVLAALRVRRRQGVSQRVEVALFDCAVTSLTTFLPGYFVGREPQRIGNRHPTMAPWNAFPAQDGWVLMCSGSDDQWRRVCELVGQPQLAAEKRYATPTLRVQEIAEIDAVVERWTRGFTVAECVERFNAAGLACGPVYTIADLAGEPSLTHRGMLRTVVDPETHAAVRVPGSVFRGSLCRGEVQRAIPLADQDRGFVMDLAQSRARRSNAVTGAAQSALAGVRVIEIGNYTTAPLVARQLAALGADVIKVEPPIGDVSRALPPHRDGQSYFFTLSNSGKRSVMLDLRSAEGKADFGALLAKADVLVENLKPGSLARLGFTEAAMARLNPRLVYCPISGFGLDSPYADRAAMDTTIQAMSGIMDLTRAGGVPYKTGISCADLAGGQFGLTAILAALEYRDRTGRGQMLDLSMQDGAAWLTHKAWNADTVAPACSTLVRCDDGYVAVESAAGTVMRILKRAGSDAESAVVDATGCKREDIVRALAEADVPSAPVLRVAEVAVHPQTVARELVVKGKTAAGVEWPLLACPIRLAATPTAVRRAIGALGADADEVFSEWLGAGEMRQAGNS